MDDYDVNLIRNYIAKMPKSKPGMSDAELEWISYSHCAAMEILERVMLETLKLPEHITGLRRQPTVDVISDYITELNYYRELCDTPRSRRMFSIEMSEAEAIACLFV